MATADAPTRVGEASPAGHVRQWGASSRSEGTESMHPALLYVVHRLDDEQRRMTSYLPDPDPSVEPEPRATRPAPSGGRAGRSLRATLALRLAVSRRRLQRRQGGSAA